MNLQLLDFQVANLSLESMTPSFENEGKSFDMEYRINYNTEDKCVFAVIFDVELEHEGKFHLNLQYVSWFKTSYPIDKTFKESDFPIVNAPAIAFPFLRSYISTLTLNSGFPPAILPSINFVEMSKNNPPKIEE